MVWYGVEPPMEVKLSLAARLFVHAAPDERTMLAKEKRQ